MSSKATSKRDSDNQSNQIKIIKSRFSNDSYYPPRKKSLQISTVKKIKTYYNLLMQKLVFFLLVRVVI